MAAIGLAVVVMGEVLDAGAGAAARDAGAAAEVAAEDAGAGGELTSVAVLWLSAVEDTGAEEAEAVAPGVPAVAPPEFASAGVPDATG